MPGSVCGRANFFGRKKSEERMGQTVEKILRSSIFSFLCIRIYVIGTEDRAEETHQGCLSFLFKSAWRKTKFFDKLNKFRGKFLLSSTEGQRSPP